MTLDNLLGMSLERIEADPLTIQRLLEAAQRNIRDAQVGLGLFLQSNNPVAGGARDEDHCRSFRLR